MVKRLLLIGLMSHIYKIIFLIAVSIYLNGCLAATVWNSTKPVKGAPKVYDEGPTSDEVSER